MKVKFIPDTHMFFSVSRDSKLKCWDADKFRHVQTLEVSGGDKRERVITYNRQEKGERVGAKRGLEWEGGKERESKAEEVKWKKTLYTGSQQGGLVC